MIEIIRAGILRKYKGLCNICGCSFTCDKSDTHITYDGYHGYRQFSTRSIKCPTRGCEEIIEVQLVFDESQKTICLACMEGDHLDHSCGKKSYVNPKYKKE